MPAAVELGVRRAVEEPLPGDDGPLQRLDRAGQPALLHIDRENAELHRDQSLENYPPRTGYDRDEYPPAMSREGGYGADIRYIDPSDNRGAGSVMGNALEAYCEDQPFRIRFIP